MVSDAKINATKETALKILTPKQTLQRLPIALAQVKARNNSKSLLNKIDQTNCLFFVSIKNNHQKNINNMIKSIQL